MVDGEDLVLLDGAGIPRRRLFPGHHPEVIGRARQVGPRFHHGAPCAEVVGGGHDRRHHRAQPQCLGPQLDAVDVVGGPPAQLGAEQRHRRSQDLEGRALRGHLGQHLRQPGRQGAELRHLGREGTRLAGIGELSFEEQVPDILERSPRGEIHRRVLAVVEEAFLAPHVAELGLRRHHALEPGRDLRPVLVGGTQAGDSHQIAQRHHAHELVAVHHRQVPVVVMGQAAPGRTDLFVGPEDIGVRRHPQLDRLRRRRRRRRRGPEQVPLGQDPRHLAPFGDDDRADARLAHGVGGIGQRRPRLTGHGGGRHEITDDGRHGHGSVPRRRGPPSRLVNTIILLRSSPMCKR